MKKTLKIGVNIYFGKKNKTWILWEVFMEYNEVKRKIIEDLELEYQYEIEDLSVYENKKLIVKFVDVSRDGSPLIRADYSKVFDRWSVAIYHSNFEFTDWLDVYNDILTMNTIEHLVCTKDDEEDQCWYLIDDEKHEELFEKYRSQLR
jgi:hypothetical protein